MKKSFFLLIITANILTITTASGCLWEFSPDDTRPFFEQYEKEKEIIAEKSDENEKEAS